MANKTITVQTRGVEVGVKEKAEEYFVSQGFRSLQDAIRIFIDKASKKEVGVNIVNEDGQDIFDVMQRARKEYERGEYKVLNPDDDVSDFIDKLVG